MSWLTWEALKLFSKKAWIWCKHHWKIVAIVIWTLVVWIVSKRNSQAMMKVLETAKKSYEDEMAAVNKTHEDEIKRRDEAIEKYNSLIDSIEEKYEDDKAALTQEKKDRIRELVESHSTDKSALDDALREEFGFEHLE